MITQGSCVAIDYTLTIDNQIVDGSKEEPLKFIAGKKQIIPYVEQQLMGLGIGDKKEVIVSPANAFGQEYEDNYQKFPRTRLPENIKPAVGMSVQVNTVDHGSRSAVISKVEDEYVVLNLNHPLAGKTLYFSIEVISID